ncbi:hypothetical protein N7490_003738 [Penicillium lividum]|nr:hypothetical protein N7490_003738 [Penicillium lividum]
MRLPPELRLKIYKYALTTPNTYINKPLIIIHDRQVFTSRPRYKALSICPTWQGEDGTARSLFSVNRKIHSEAEDTLYTTHTLFFRNSFDLARIGDFLDTLSMTARSQIRSVGFEVYFFVHGDCDDGGTCARKRRLKEYGRAREVLEGRLPGWREVLFYLDPRYYYPVSCAGGRELAARGVLELAKMFGDGGELDVTFYPLPDSQQRLVEEQVIWRSNSPERRGLSLEKDVSSSHSGSGSGALLHRMGDAGKYPVALLG